MRNNAFIKSVIDAERKPLWSSFLTNSQMLGVILGLAFIIRFLFLLTTDIIGTEGDGLCRLLQTQTWVENTKFIPGGLSWLPLHHVLIATGVYFGIPIAWAGRLLSLMAGLGSIYLLFAIVHRVFDRETAFFTGVILAVLPFHVVFSVIPLSEILFLCLILASLWGIFRFVDSKRVFWLFMSSCFANYANLVRFEGWVFAALLPFVLLLYDRNIWRFFLYGWANALSLVWYVATSMATKGMPLYGITTSDAEVLANNMGGDSLWGNLSYLWGDELGVLPVFIVPFVVIGVILHIRKRSAWGLLLLGLFFFTLVSVKYFNKTLNPLWRYYLIPGMLLLPFGVSVFIRLSVKKWIGWGLLASILVLNGSILAMQHHELQLKNVKETGYKESADWVMKHRKKQEKVLVDVEAFANCDWRRLAGLNDNTQAYFPKYESLKGFSHYEAFSQRVFQRVIDDPLFRYLIYRRGTKVDSMLKKASIRAYIRDVYDMIETLDTNDFVIQELRYARLPHTAYLPIDTIVPKSSDKIPQHIDDVFSYFGQVGMKRNQGWQALIALILVKLEGEYHNQAKIDSATLTIQAVAPHFPKSLRRYYEERIPLDTFLQDVHSWSKNWEDEVREAEKAYAQVYAQWMKEGGLKRRKMFFSLLGAVGVDLSYCYKRFKEPGQVENTGWMALCANMYETIFSTEVSNRPKAVKEFFKSYAPDFPHQDSIMQFYFEKKQYELFIRNLRVWAKTHPAKVDSLEKRYMRNYEEWVKVERNYPEDIAKLLKELDPSDKYQIFEALKMFEGGWDMKWQLAIALIYLEGMDKLDAPFSVEEFLPHLPQANRAKEYYIEEERIDVLKEEVEKIMKQYPKEWDRAYRAYRYEYIKWQKGF